MHKKCNIKLLHLLTIFLLIFILVFTCSEIKLFTNDAIKEDNILPNLDGLVKKTRGITYRFENGNIRITGTPTASSYVSLLGSSTEIPKEFRSGDTLRLKFTSTTKYLTLGIKVYNSETPDGKWLIKTTESIDFYVPDLSSYTGLSVQILTVKTNNEFNMLVSPKVTVLKDNILPVLDGKVHQIKGVTYECKDDRIYIKGTPTSSSCLTLLGSTTEIPSALKSGERLKINFVSGTKYLVLGIKAYNSSYPEGKWLIKTSENTEFVMPDLSAYTGVAVQILAVYRNSELNVIVKPKITIVDENILSKSDGLVKETRGIIYQCYNGHVSVKGKPSASSYITLLGSTKEVPTEFKTGDILHISLDSGTNYLSLGIKVYNSTYPDGKWLIRTSESIDYIVPDLSEYTGVTIQLLTVELNKNFDVELSPKVYVTTKNYDLRYLTIIDDDGDIHFKTDVIPFMNRLNITISSAVTPTRVGTSKRWMNWDDVAYCSNNGAEILCHMYNHYTGTEVLSISNEQLLTEFELAIDIFKEKGIDVSKLLVYSSSTGNNVRVQTVAAQVFSAGVKIGGNSLNNQFSNRYALSRYRIDYASTEGKEDWNLDDMLDYVDQIVQTGGWGIWMMHTSNAIYRQRVELDSSGNIKVDKNGIAIPMFDSKGEMVLDIDGAYPTVGNTTLLPMLEKIILYAKSLGVEIVSANRGYEAYF